jgi:hypothetical protein
VRKRAAATVAMVLIIYPLNNRRADPVGVGIGTDAEDIPWLPGLVTDAPEFAVDRPATMADDSAAKVTPWIIDQAWRANGMTRRTNKSQT